MATTRQSGATRGFVRGRRAHTHSNRIRLTTRGTNYYNLRACAIVKEIECLVENLNGMPSKAREEYPLIYPDVIDLLVDQRNSLVHNYQHGLKQDVNWEWIWDTQN